MLNSTFMFNTTFDPQYTFVILFINIIASVLFTSVTVFIAMNYAKKKSLYGKHNTYNRKKLHNSSSDFFSYKLYCFICLFYVYVCYLLFYIHTCLFDFYSFIRFG